MAGEMPQSDKPYLNFLIPAELLKRIDAFRYKNCFPTRAKAIIWLIEFALAQKPVAPKEE